MARTYIPTFRYFLERTNSYIARHQAVISAGMTSGQQTAFLSFITCLVNLLAALGVEEIDD